VVYRVLVVLTNKLSLKTFDNDAYLRATLGPRNCVAYNNNDRGGGRREITLITRRYCGKSFPKLSTREAGKRGKQHCSGSTAKYMALCK